MISSFGDSVMDEIAVHIMQWMQNRANNALEPGSAKAAFDQPLLGVGAGDDPLFEYIKNDIGPSFYWTPLEAFTAAFPEETVTAKELSVLAWILPQTEETRLAHRKQQTMPSIEWSKARHYGEQVNNALRLELIDYFQNNSIPACAPTLLPQWDRHISDRYGFASCWSERHAAYACGLGTFGLSDGLITTAGKAIRVGSVIVKKRLPVTSRPYTSHTQYCLFHAKGKCQGCIRRCPVEAISEAGHDKEKCKQYIRNVTAIHVEKSQLGVRVNSCGLCQTKVPCEAKNPLKKTVPSPS